MKKFGRPHKAWLVLGCLLLIYAGMTGVMTNCIGVLSAEEVLKFHHVPYDNLCPVYPNCRYTLPDFTLDTFQASTIPTAASPSRRRGLRWPTSGWA